MSSHEDDGVPIAELSAFVEVLLSDCFVTRCDDGLYICQTQAQGRGTVPGQSFAVGRGELAAPIRAMTATHEETPDPSSGSDSPDDVPSSDDGASEDGTTDSESDYAGRAQVVVNVGRRCKRKRKRK